MTLKVFFTIVCASISNLLVGQTVEIGIKGGLNLSDIVITNFTNPDAESMYQTKTGMHAGIFAAVGLYDNFNLLGELLYSNRGVRTTERIDLHYVTMPILMSYKLTEKFSIEGGPEIGYLASAKANADNVTNTWNNKLDIGVNLGAVYKLSEKIGLNARYYAGFSSVIDGVNEQHLNFIPTEETIKYQNRVLQLAIYYIVFD